MKITAYQLDIVTKHEWIKRREKDNLLLMIHILNQDVLLQVSKNKFNGTIRISYELMRSVFREGCTKLLNRLCGLGLLKMVKERGVKRCRTYEIYLTEERRESISSTVFLDVELTDKTVIRRAQKAPGWKTQWTEKNHGKDLDIHVPLISSFWKDVDADQIEDKTLANRFKRLQKGDRSVFSYQRSNRINHPGMHIKKEKLYSLKTKQVVEFDIVNSYGQTMLRLFEQERYPYLLEKRESPYLVRFLDEEVSKFRKLLENDLYTWLQASLALESREKAKAEFLKWILDPARRHSSKGICGLLEREFPNIHDYIGMKLAKVGESAFSIQLATVEQEWIHEICEKAHQQGIPLDIRFDAIVCHQEDQEKVQAIIDSISGLRMKIKPMAKEKSPAEILREKLLKATGGMTWKDDERFAEPISSPSSSDTYMPACSSNLQPPDDPEAS